MCVVRAPVVALCALWPGATWIHVSSAASPLTFTSTTVHSVKADLNPSPAQVDVTGFLLLPRGGPHGAYIPPQHP